MAEQTSFPKERLEDVFQDEIIKAFVNITSFEKFARSKNGLCLDQANIQTIVEDHGGNVEKQKMEMCFKWREIQGEKATVPNIRHLLQKFFRKDNPSDYIVLENGIFGVYKTRFLCERSNVYLGVQISEVTGPQTRAIKIVPKNEKHLREAQILAKLGNHVNVVSIIHAGIHKGDPQDYIYIAMEHSWTQTVRNMIEEWIKLQKQGKPFHEFIAWSLVEQLMRAVEFLHSHNIIHRDLKPDNILASDDWRFFKVTDYGLSKEVKDGYATIQTNAYIGTEGYRSLETYDPNAKITAKADMFSAGATIGEIMANGKHPFGEDPDLWTHNIKNNKNLDLRHLRVSYKVEVTYFIKRMLEMDPEKRPTAKEVLNDVSIYFQTFQLKNQQSTAGQSLATASKAMSELSITDKRKKATVPKIRNFYKTMQKYFRKDNSSVLTGTTADESLASTSKAMTELSITEKVNAIIMFNWEEMHLFSFELSSKKWNPMQEFYKYDSWDATVVSGKHIYILHNREVHQLEYSDPAAEWKKMSSMIENHGSFPSAAVSNGLIYVCGSSFQYASGKEAYRSVERYDVAQDRWDHMCSMNIGKTHPVVVATEDYVYCMGDCDIRRDQSVERFDTNLNKWENVRSSPRATSNVSAAVVKNRIYTADTKGVLYYNIQNDSWRIIHLTSQWPFMKEAAVKILAIDEELYIIGPIDVPKKKGRKAIYLFNPETKQMTLVEKFKDYGIHHVSDCLAVKF